MKNTLAGSSSFGLSNLFSTFPRAPCSLYSSFKLCVQFPNPLDLHSDLLVSLPSSPFDPEQWRMVCVNKIICEELSYSCDLLKHLGGREEMRGQIQVKWSSWGSSEQITQEKEGASSQDFFISSAENPAEFSRTTSLELTQLGMLPLIRMSLEMAINITS
ncbi:hypothetical protein GBA52_019828 [Prunus armeniaca]|nr:hypothetical protein GBA52_019828 [Prunus armeniaca]